MKTRNATETSDLALAQQQLHQPKVTCTQCNRRAKLQGLNGLNEDTQGKRNK
jgi:hypothetical protein